MNLTLPILYYLSNYLIITGYIQFSTTLELNERVNKIRTLLLTAIGFPKGNANCLMEEVTSTASHSG